MSWFNSWILWIQGVFIRKVAKNARDVNVQTAAFNNAIIDKENRYMELSEAAAGMIRVEEDFNEELQRINHRIQMLRNVNHGALSKARTISLSLRSKGLSADQIHVDPEYLKCMESYNNATLALKSTLLRQGELQESLLSLRKTLAIYRSELSALNRNKEDLEREKRESLVDIQISERRAAVHKLMSGIFENKIDENLRAVREARKQIKAEARLAEEIADADGMIEEGEFILEAQRQTIADEFNRIVGLCFSEQQLGDPIS